ncbi:hypothetical protein HAX54_007862, partial [Datura stramonium]|nr:hypothetical protein [Datura stramonium]
SIGARVRAAARCKKGPESRKKKESFCARHAKCRCQLAKRRLGIALSQKTWKKSRKRKVSKGSGEAVHQCEARFKVAESFKKDDLQDIYDQFQIRDWDPFTIPLDPYFQQL